MKNISKKPNQQVFVIWRTEGHDDIKMPWVDVRAKELCQYGRMLCSDNTELSYSGKMQLKAAAQELHDLKMEVYLERLKHEETRQKLSPAGKKGAKARWHSDGNRWGEDNVVQKIIASLAATTDRWGGPMKAKELWPLLYSELEQAHLNPEEVGPAETCEESKMQWEGNSSGVSFKTFQNMLSTARAE